MHDPSNSVPVAAALAPLDESRALYLTALRPRSHPSFHLTHLYFELVYAPALGPSATLLGRYLGRVLAAHGDEKVQLCPAALSLELGLRSSSANPLGERSLLRRAIAVSNTNTSPAGSNPSTSGCTSRCHRSATRSETGYPRPPAGHTTSSSA